MDAPRQEGEGVECGEDTAVAGATTFAEPQLEEEHQVRSVPRGDGAEGTLSKQTVQCTAEGIGIQGWNVIRNHIRTRTARCLLHVPETSSLSAQD